MWKSDRREGETLLLYFFCSTRKNFWEKFAINFTRSSISFMNILTYSLAIFSIVVPSFTINFVSLFRLDLYFPLRFNFLLLRDFKHRNAVFINWLFIQIIKCKAIGCILWLSSHAFISLTTLAICSSLNLSKLLEIEKEFTIYAVLPLHLLLHLRLTFYCTIQLHLRCFFFLRFSFFTTPIK